MTIKKTAISIFLAALVLALLDQACKWLAYAYLRTPVNLGPWFSLSYAENTGIAWSIPLPYFLLLALNLLLVALFLWLAVRYFDFNKSLTRIVVVLVMAGACGNIVDRLSRGHVVDFISVGFWPVFNLADAFLTAGIFLILLFYAKIKRTD